MRDGKPDGFEVERHLDRLAHIGPPSGLRERVLGSARAAQRRAVLRPGLRIAAAAAAALILACLAIEPLLVYQEAGRLEALLGGRSRAQEAAETFAEMAEILAADAGLPERQLRFRNAVLEGLERDAERARGELKGRIEHETLEGLY